MPGQRWARRVRLLTRSPSPNPAKSQKPAPSSRKLCSRDETEPRVLLRALHKDLIHHFFSPPWKAIRDFNAYSSLIIDIYPGKSRSGMTCERLELYI